MNEAERRLVESAHGTLRYMIECDPGAGFSFENPPKYFFHEWKDTKNIGLTRVNIIGTNGVRIQMLPVEMQPLGAEYEYVVQFNGVEVYRRSVSPDGEDTRDAASLGKG